MCKRAALVERIRPGLCRLLLNKGSDLQFMPPIMEGNLAERRFAESCF